MSRNKQNNMVVHVETIVLQKDLVRRALKSILPRIKKNLYDIEVRFVPILTYLIDDNMACHLQ